MSGEEGVAEAVGGGEGGRGALCLPAIYDNVPEDARLRTDEVFAPVAHIDGYGDIGEAIARIKADTPSLFTTRSTPAANGGTTDNADIPAEFASDPKKRAAYALGKRMSPHAQRK